MLITTEYRTHWIDSSGRCYAQRYPFHAGLSPVVNLDEVRAWLDLATSDGLRAVGFPGDENDWAVFCLGKVVERAAATDDHMAASTASELTDDVPHYHQSADADWRTPFLAMRERWPLPPTGPAEIRNLTPHAVVVHEITFAPSGTIARATEEATDAEPILIRVPDPGTSLDPGGRSGTYAAPNESVIAVPTTTTRYTGLVDLPDPEPGVYLIVSMVVAQVAAARGRWTGDLLVPGQQMRDSAGRIVGCRSLARVA